MSRAHLPWIVGLTALALGRATLHLEDGSSVSIDAGRDCAALMPDLLILMPGPVYRVPTHLHATLQAALCLDQAGRAPLILTGLELTTDEATFSAVDAKASQCV